MQRSFDRNYFLAHMVLLPKKHRTHYSRPKRCSQKVLQTRLLYTFPLKMYQYFKYSNSLLFPFDRCRRVASGLLISEVQAFLQKPSSIIIILIFVNRTLRRIKSSRLIGLVLHAVTFLQGTSQPQRQDHHQQANFMQISKKLFSRIRKLKLAFFFQMFCALSGISLS